MKFVADGMLGRLTRWLRMLGCDVEYKRNLADEDLIKTARDEGRILLTRDLNLYKQATAEEVDSHYVEGGSDAEKLASLAKRFNFDLEVDVKTSRCPKCNTNIQPISKEVAAERIPLKTSVHYNEFWECPNCGKIYWRGAHWKRIEITLGEARKKLESS